MAHDVPTNPLTVVAAGYDALGSTFDTWASAVSDPARDELLAAFLTRLPPRARLLDVGCGSATTWVGGHADRFAITGIDISAGRIEAARRNLPAASFVVADVMAIEFDAASFDGIAALYSIGHVPAQEHESLFTRLARWLRPGGLLLASLPADEDPGSTGPWIGGQKMFFASLGAARYEQILGDGGWSVIDLRVGVAVEPDGPTRFCWVLAEAPGHTAAADGRRQGPL